MIQEAKAALARPMADVEPNVSPDMQLPQVEQQLSQAETRLSQAKAQLTAREAEVQP